MVNFCYKFWVIFCVFNTISCLREWPQSIVVPSVNDGRHKLSSLESKDENDQEFLNNNYFTKLTVLNVGSNEYTTKAITDTTYDYKHLILTTAIRNNGDFTSGLKSTQEDGTPTKDNVREKYQKHDTMEGEKSDQDSNDSGSETVSSETSTDETRFQMLTPARRIYNGHKTKIKHYPFLATVHVMRRFVCSGAIIKSDLVITAASCLKRWQKWLHRQTNKTKVDTTTEPITLETTTSTTIKTTTKTKKKTFKTKKTTTSKVTITKLITTNELTGTDNVTGTENTTVSTKHMTDTKHLTDIEHDTGTLKNGTETEIPATTDSSEERDSSSYESTIAETTITFETPPSEPKVGTLVVRVGTSYYRLEGRVLNVVKIYIHPTYREFNLQNNLVILRLAQHLLFKHKSVRTIAISTTAADMAVGTNVTIVGWGAKTYHNKVFNALWNLIHKSVLTVTSPYECIKTYTTRFVSSTNFCAVNVRYEGACNRDEGVPAVVDGILVGLVSFVSPKCGPPGDPTVFTNLRYYNDWISEIMAIKPASNSSESSSEEINKTMLKQSVAPQNRLVYNKDGYQDKLNDFLMKMGRQYRARGYHRFENEGPRETVNIVSHTKEEEFTENENEIGLLTTLPMKPLNSLISHQRRYRSDVFMPEASNSRRPNENNFLLTPNTAGTVDNTLDNPLLQAYYRTNGTLTHHRTISQ